MKSIQCLMYEVLPPGPKLYSALESLLDDKHHGSTRLHLDLADAVNIMTYAGLAANGLPGYATWHIFKADDVEKLREYLSTKHAEGDILGDLIHNQQTFLSPSMLQELRQKHGVYPYVVQQHVGEAVFIPAGCAHQVRVMCMEQCLRHISFSRFQTRPTASKSHATL